MPLLHYLQLAMTDAVGPITLKRMVAPKVTIEYPEVKRPMAPRFRGLPSLRTDPETNEPLCVACGLCARICPTTCLEMNVVPSEEGDRELAAQQQESPFAVQAAREARVAESQHWQQRAR